jgi:hypothetical protein
MCAEAHVHNAVNRLPDTPGTNALESAASGIAGGVVLSPTPPDQPGDQLWSPH